MGKDIHLLAQGLQVGYLGLQVAFRLHALPVNLGAHNLHALTWLLIRRVCSEGLHGQGDVVERNGMLRVTCLVTV